MYNKNKKYNNIVNNFCFYESSSLSSKINMFFFQLLLNSLKFFILDNDNSVHTELSLSKIKLYKSGLKRLSSNKQIMFAFSLPILKKENNVLNAQSLLIWDNSEFAKSLFVWEQFYSPEFLFLNGFCNWTVFFLKHDALCKNLQWFSQNLEQVLLTFLVTKMFSANFNFYISPLIFEELAFAINAFVGTNDKFILHQLTKTILKWSFSFCQDFDSNGYTNIKKMRVGGWLQPNISLQESDLNIWTDNPELDLDPYKLFYDFEDDDIDFDSFDLYVWPWTTNLNLYFSDYNKLKPLYSGLIRPEDIDLFETLFFNMKNQSNDTLDELFLYFSRVFNISAWDKVSTWIDAFWPQYFNWVEVVKFRPFVMLFFLEMILSWLNKWFLYGLNGADRRNILFRFFFFFFLKKRGLFFKWFSLSLKSNSFNLPWEEEIKYILNILEQDQLFYLNRCGVELKLSLENYLFFFKDKYPFFFFWDFFFKNYFSKLVLKRREELYPDFLPTLTRLLQTNSKFFIYYALYVGCHVYLTVLCDILLKKENFLVVVMNYEAGLNKSNFSNSFQNQYKRIFFRKKSQYNFTNVTKYLSFFFYKKKDKYFLLSNLSIYAFLKSGLDLMYHLFIRYIWNFLSLYINSTVFRLNESFLKEALWVNNINSDSNKIFLSGIKKSFKAGDNKTLNRFFFFYKYIQFIQTFIYKFTIKIMFLFLLKLIAFYFSSFFLFIFLRGYNIFWLIVYKTCIWLWKIKHLISVKETFLKWNNNLSAFERFKQTYYGFSLEEAHKEFFIYQSYNKSLFNNSRFYPDLCKWVMDFIQTDINPFKDPLWEEIQAFAFAFVFFRKLKRKNIAYRKGWSFFFQGLKLNSFLNSIVAFSFWSFSLSFFFFYIYRLLFLFFFFSFSFVSFLIIQFMLFVYFFFCNLFCIFWYICFVSILYPFLVAFRVLVRFFCLLFNFLYNIFWVASISFIYVLYNMFRVLFFMLTKQLFFVNIWCALLYKIYFFIHVLYKMFFVLFTIIKIIFCFFIFLFLLLVRMPLGIFDNQNNIFFSKIRFLFFQENVILQNILKEVIYIASFFFKCVLLFLGFFFFLFKGLGWRLISFEYMDGSGIIKPESPVKKAYHFLDKLSLWFFFILFEFNLNWQSYLVWFLYSTGDFILVVNSCLFFYLVYILLLCKNFIVNYSFFKKFLFILSVWRKKIYTIYIFVFYVFVNGSVISFLDIIKKRIFPYIQFKSSLANISIYSVVCLMLLNKARRFLNFKWWLELFITLLSKDKFWSVFFKRIKQDFFLRDLQELLVFISLFYQYRSFYWAFVLQLSITFGDLGWWLNYFSQKVVKLNYCAKNSLFNYILFFQRNVHFNFLYDINILRFSKYHFYYLQLNLFLQNIFRNKSYIIDTVFVDNKESFVKNSNFLLKMYSKEHFLKRIGNFFGFSFLLEILLQRFQQPVLKYFFGGEFNDTRIHRSFRFKYFKDFFSEFNWLVKYTYNQTKQTTDDFIWKIFLNFGKQLESKSFYFKKFRKTWKYSVLKRTTKVFKTFLPVFRWNNYNLFKVILEWVVYCFLFVFLFIVFFIFCIIGLYISFFFFCLILLKFLLRLLKNFFFL